MGAVLIRSAHSPNIKERHDCSTALFDAQGELVMQAEHIPVHLGSMPDAVAAILGSEQSPGDLWISTTPTKEALPARHHPDRADLHARGLIGFAASRAHHADVGGPTPGGMPAHSTRLEDEGVVISPTRVGTGTLEEIAGRMRGTRERLADLRAQQAALAVGDRRVAELCERHGEATIREGMAEILNYCERRTRARIAALPDGRFAAHDVRRPAPTVRTTRS